MSEIINSAKKIGIKAAKTAGEITKKHFTKNIRINEKNNSGDLVTEVDYIAEKEILYLIRNEFPNHKIMSEENGWSGVNGDWLWLIDPLDGTNNYAIGFPVFAVSITLLYKKEPVLGVIYDSMLEKVYIAEKGKGAFCEDEFIKIETKNNLDKMTLGWIQGHDVQNDNQAMDLKYLLEEKCKRILNFWAPSLLWCMLARGDIDGIVLYNSEIEDLYAGLLMAKEAGAIIFNFEGNNLNQMESEPYIIACHPDKKEILLEVINEKLR